MNPTMYHCYVYSSVTLNTSRCHCYEYSQTVILRALARRISWDPSHTLRMTKRMRLSCCG